MKTNTVSICSRFVLFSTLLLAFTSIIAYADQDEELFVFPPGFYEADYFGPPRGEDDEDIFHGPVNEEGQFSYIIRVDEIGLIDEQEARGVLSSGQRYIEDDPTSMLYEQQLFDQIDIYVSMISQKIGREVIAGYRFVAFDPGFTVWLYEEEAELVEDVPGIIKVQREHYEYPQSYRSPNFIGADAIWGSPAHLQEYGDNQT